MKNKEEATKKFEEIAEAYEVLSDPEKRRVFDQVGEEGLKQGGGGGGQSRSGGGFQSSGTTFEFHGSDPFDIFRNVFGSGGFDFGDTSTTRSQQSRYNNNGGFSGFQGFDGFNGFNGGFIQINKEINKVKQIVKTYIIQMII
eukprot:CAMPEP_0196767720 /NCGR_PEP_ID=MMETSP1095-20130614/41892_1 /TAXON_ID=96789 ORGANISM="Chromulina nebulosa, Strain UTEXLB2642" /NCGR_SAMPLE_ID=MMETSP1095 /ASSEMBLY_ACC=CAM_ASM_000446 /LENGTH=141 /DNA_ID=CAMNT_0042136305 /DNA_START=128 /DNA_END=554 /DNA_ORIENTATION=-